MANFSHALYNKATYTELSMHESRSISNEQKLIVGDDIYNTLTRFYDAPIEEQRKMLDSNPRGVIEAHVVSIIKLDNHPQVIAYALPSLDGILFGIILI